MATVTFSHLLLRPLSLARALRRTDPRDLYLEFRLGVASTRAVVDEEAYESREDLDKVMFSLRGPVREPWTAGQLEGLPPCTAQDEQDTLYHPATLGVGKDEALAPALRIRLRSSDLILQRTVLGQGALLTRDLLSSTGPLRTELYTHGSLGSAMGTLHLYLRNQGLASLFSPEDVVQDGTAEALLSQEDGGPEPGEPEAAPCIPLHWGSWARDSGPAWDGAPPPSFDELAERRADDRQNKPHLGVVQSLALLARCKLALQVIGRPLPQDALPQSGWRGVAGDTSSWEEFVRKEELKENVQRFGITRDLLSLMNIRHPSYRSGDEMSRPLWGSCEPLGIARALSNAGVVQQYGPLYQYVYGRSIEEAVRDLPACWVEEDRLMRWSMEVDPDDDAYEGP